MFLDEQLYQHVINRNLENISDYQDMINELYKICEDSWKPKLLQNLTYANVKIILDRVFNSWDLFIKRLYKEDYYLVHIISKCSYKETFMKNKEAKRIYDLGK